MKFLPVIFTGIFLLLNLLTSINTKICHEMQLNFCQSKKTYFDGRIFSENRTFHAHEIYAIIFIFNEHKTPF